MRELNNVNLFGTNELDSLVSGGKEKRQSSAKLAGEELTKYFQNGTQKYKSSSSSSEAGEAIKKQMAEMGAYWDQKAGHIKFEPGKYVHGNSYTIINKNGDTQEVVYDTDDPQKTWKVEYDYDYDEDGHDHLSKQTYKDNTGKVRLTEEYSSNTEDKNKLIHQTVVKNGSGKILYTKIVTKIWNSATKVYDAYWTYKDSSGNEISEDDAFELRNRCLTDSMKEYDVNGRGLDHASNGDISFEFRKKLKDAKASED